MDTETMKTLAPPAFACLAGALLLFGPVIRYTFLPLSGWVLMIFGFWPVIHAFILCLCMLIFSFGKLKTIGLFLGIVALIAVILLITGASQFRPTDKIGFLIKLMPENVQNGVKIAEELTSMIAWPAWGAFALAGATIGYLISILISLFNDAHLARERQARRDHSRYTASTGSRHNGRGNIRKSTLLSFTQSAGDLSRTIDRIVSGRVPKDRTRRGGPGGNSSRGL